MSELDPIKGWKSLRQFILYKTVASTTRPGKTDKFPIDFRTGSIVNAQDPNNWVEYSELENTISLWGPQYGIGFVFTKKDPYFFIDIDNCLMPDNTWSPIAVELCNMFQGAAIEISSSGKGLHIFGRCEPIVHACKNSQFNIELYTSERFVALTQTSIIGDVDTDHTAAMIDTVQKYFLPPTGLIATTAWTNGPVSEWRGPMDDIILIERMIKSHSTNALFNGGVSFRDLWEAKGEVLANAYPSSTPGQEYDASSADAALAQHLAFWTGNDCERMKRLMFKSGLVRDKWQRDDYIYRTILHACNLKKEWLKDKPVQDSKLTINNKPQKVEGKTLLSIDEQVQLFEGCVYVQDEHKILVPGGRLLKQDQFRATYGGYSFIMDQNNERVVRNAWEAFTESQAIRFPRAHTTGFLPIESEGAIIERDNELLVNIWSPVNVKKIKGDVSLFLTHLRKLIPDENDAKIFLYYMAACVQYQGIKFQWAPVLQGAEGNGKTLFSDCVAHAVGRRYSHFPRAQDIADKYNDWLYGHTFIGIEDIFDPNPFNGTIEVLKPWITSDQLEIHAKFSSKMMKDVCCNFIINSNFKDGLRKTKNDRRYAHFFTPQQEKAHLVRDGLTGNYFPRLYGWLKKEKGYAIVAEYLSTLEIPDEYNPAHRQPAPITTSTEEALQWGMGWIEQEIMEQIEQGTPGFRGGWISSTAFERLLERLKATRIIPPNKRRDLLRGLGYDYHGALVAGRVNCIVAPDGNKPRLYVKQDADVARITQPAEVIDAYTKAQN